MVQKEGLVRIGSWEKICIMFKLDGGWVGQDQFEHCSNLEIRTEKWTLPKSASLTEILQLLHVVTEKCNCCMLRYISIPLKDIIFEIGFTRATAYTGVCVCFSAPWIQMILHNLFWTAFFKEEVSLVIKL